MVVSCSPAARSKKNHRLSTLRNCDLLLMVEDGGVRLVLGNELPWDAASAVGGRLEPALTM